MKQGLAISPAIVIAALALVSACSSGGDTDSASTRPAVIGGATAPSAAANPSSGAGAPAPAGNASAPAPATSPAPASSSAAPAERSTLIGRAVLPAATFADGPNSANYFNGAATNGQSVPFAKQPVQGFSALQRNADGSFFVMADNGFGAIENSADFNLRVYNLRPDFKTKTGGSGTVRVESFIELKDPNKKIPFAIVNHFSAQRVLTGADFDIESMQRAADGTLWFGDEFGPFLLHTDAQGVVLEAPYALPDFDNPGKEVRSPQNPQSEESATLRVMNAFRAHARAHGAERAPVFSPYFVQLKYDANGVKSDPDAHYARGKNPQPGLKQATSEVHDVKSLRDAGYPVVPYTINDKAKMTELLKAGVSGVISDRPDLLYQAVAEFDANGDGKPGDFLDAAGLIDGAKFDAQGHRGARNLRPENTLPAFEAALDNLMTTLEFDNGITSDGVPIVKHDPYIETQKCRRADNQPYLASEEVLIKDLTQAQIQARFICDKLFRGPEQLNDAALSPVASALAAERRYVSPYVMPTTQDVFDLVAAYQRYYESGAGSAHPQAAARAKNAARARFNIETKINPRSDRDAKNNVYKARTVGADAMADALIAVIKRNRLEARADIQSFDFRTLLRVQECASDIRTVYLFGDFPIYADPANTDDGTNMQDEGGANTPWMAGVQWPYRSTALANAFRAKRSGGFEGMAISTDGAKLYPLLELALTGAADDKTLLLHEFDLAAKKYNGAAYKYRLEANGTNIGDFVMINRDEGIVIERDASQGDLTGNKTLYSIKLGKPADYVTKQPLVDLMKIDDPGGLSAIAAQAGDVGLGATFAMPYTTIEDVYVVDPRTLLVINDNNFPFSIGRHVGSKQPDDNDFILLQLPRALNLTR